MNKASFSDNDLVFNKFYDKDMPIHIFYELPEHFPESIKEPYKELSFTVGILRGSFSGSIKKRTS